jgi:DNA mismatch endonuclease (patch repair protein)
MAWRSPPSRPYRPRDVKVTSTMMSAVKNKNGRAEMMLRKALHARGYRYRLHARKIIGKPDIIFARKRVAIFVDGDFWHGRALIEEGVPGLLKGLRSRNSEWWIQKITKTVERDKTVTSELEEDGWLVLRFWESELLADLAAVLQRVELTLR